MQSLSPVAGALQFSLTCFIAIFPIVNPFSAAALLVALTPNDTSERRTERVLGQPGQAVVSKMMGLIILCVGEQFLINGLSIIAPSIFTAEGAAP